MLYTHASPGLLFQPIGHQGFHVPTWCVYEHWLHLHPPKGEPPPEPRLMLLKWGPLTEAHDFAQHSRNWNWLQLMRQPGAWVEVRITHTGDEVDCGECFMAQINRATDAPCFNSMVDPTIPGTDKRVTGKRSSTRVACSNGKVYASQAEAARDLGIHQGNISRVIGKTGYRCNGLQFWRV